jgi:hypothetical protein
MIPAPAPSPQQRPTVTTEPDLESFRRGARGAHPLDTADPIMAAMGAYFAEKEAARKAELAELKARARRIIEARE